VDHRSDIFAFGVVLHEMLSGRRAFRGETSADTLTAILREDPPDLSEAGREIPPVLARIAHRCLEKDPAERFQSARDLAFALGDLVELSAVSAPSAPVAASSERAPWRRWGLALTALVLLVAVGVWRLSSRRSTAPMITRPLTSFAGAERQPALSPDGDRVAFAWNGGERLDSDIYVTLIGPGRPLQITDGLADDLAPVWSPDGQQLAFVRIAESDEESGVFVVPALGGAARRVSPRGPRVTIAVHSPLSWSADGKDLAIADGESGIVLLSLESLTERRLTPPLARPAAYRHGDWCAAFSPDGTTLAFVRSVDVGVGNIHTVPTAGGEPKRLTFVEESIQGLDWTPDGRHIVFASGPIRGIRRLWRIRSEGGEREPLPVGGETAATPSFSRRQGRLVYASEPPQATDIWRVDLGRSTRSSRPETVVIASSRADRDVAISPDGRRIAFQSTRSGSAEIWVCDADGANPAPLTSFGGPYAGTPRWSPDGGEIAFDSPPEGHTDIFVVRSEGGPSRRLTSDPANDVVPSWSRDGRWVYFASNRSGAWQVFKVPADGGPASQVTSGGGFAPLESPDGRFVYYAKGVAERGLWRVPVEGGKESVVLEDLDPDYWGYWVVVDDGIYFVDPRVRSVATSAPNRSTATSCLWRTSAEARSAAL
jgi:Tol biopolymer transport system component